MQNIDARIITLRAHSVYSTVDTSPQMGKGKKRRNLDCNVKGNITKHRSFLAMSEGKKMLKS